MPLVLAESEATESGIRYEDRTGVEYQFPRMYLRLMQPGERFVYYRGRKRESGGRVPQVYFGTGIIGPVRPDPLHPNRSLCEILDYVAFEAPVFFKRGPSDYLESGGERRGFFQRGVRTISEADFAMIVAAAGAQSTEQASPTDLAFPMYGTAENNIAVEQFAVEQAVAELRARYPGSLITPQVRNNPGFDILIATGSELTYVEVKGTRRPIPRCIITQGEVEFSRRHPLAYHLLIFYEVDLSARQYRLWWHEGPIEQAGFRLVPLQWTCEPIGGPPSTSGGPGATGV